jgi:hypothetical protein
LKEKERYTAEMDDRAQCGHYARTSAWSRPSPGLPPTAAARPEAVVLAPGTLEAVVRRALAPLTLADPSLFREVVLNDGSAGAPETDSLLSPADEIALVYGAVPVGPPAATRILFTRRRLGDNWFSHWHELRRTAVVSMADGDGSFTIPAEAFAAYEIVLHALRLLAPSYAPEKLMHDDTRGCLFDFCESRTDVKAKLSGGRVCDPCREALAATGIPTDRVLNLVNAVRLLAATPQAVH